MTLDTVLSSLLVLLALACAVTDLRSGIIPNRLTLPAVALALLGRLAGGGGPALVEGLAGLLLTFAGPGLVYLVTRGAGIGGGDVKLFAALGTLAGPVAGIQILIGSCLFLLLYALFVLAWRGRLLATLVQSLQIMLRAVVPKRFEPDVAALALTSLRMGPFIALAVLVVVGGAWLREILPWLSFL